jgi:hypothetical protein
MINNLNSITNTCHLRAKLSSLQYYSNHDSFRAYDANHATRLTNSNTTLKYPLTHLAS